MCGPPYNNPNSLHLDPKKVVFPCVYEDSLQKKIGDPLDPGKQAISIKNSFLPL